MLSLVVLAFSAPAAHAAFPGKNGKIAFENLTGSFTGPWTMDPDGGNQTALPVTGRKPRWSPDGKTLAIINFHGDIVLVNPDGTNPRTIFQRGADAFVDGVAWSPDGAKLAMSYGACDVGGGPCDYTLLTINADGTNLHALGDPTHPVRGRFPDWSPDGTRIAYSTPNYFGAPEDIHTIRPDGTDDKRLTFDTTDTYPRWSPDESKIVFRHLVCASACSSEEIYTINPDGTGKTLLKSGSGAPAWSPDGSRIAFVIGDCTTTPCTSDVYVMNADGSGQTRLTNSGSGGYPDWQPIPINGYARPKGATPFQTYLTVAYKPCALPSEQHGSPLAVLSCNPPQQASDFLTVGTLDANGQAAKAVGSVRYDVKPGTAGNPADDADVKMNVSVKDVRMKSDLSDYAGELEVTSSRRITDKLNTPAPDGATQAATTQDTPLSITVPCAPTGADTTVGSTCAISTTADALVPGQVAENARSNWELGQIQIFDGGSDSDADTTADNTLFMDQGIFVP